MMRPTTRHVWPPSYFDTEMKLSRAMVDGGMVSNISEGVQYDSNVV